MIKYASRGLIQEGHMPSILLDILYATISISFMSVFLLSSLIHAFQLKDKSEDVIEIGTRALLRFGFSSVFLVIILLMFMNIQHKKRKGKLKVPKIQRNILTLSQNCISYFIYVLTSWFILFLRINKENQFFSVFRTLQIASIIFIVQLLVFYFLVPLFVIVNLKNAMPQLFNEFNDKVTHFYITPPIFVPRQQELLPLKPFKKDARFGSENKFMKINEDIEIHYSGEWKKSNEIYSKDISFPALTSVEI